MTTTRDLAIPRARHTLPAKLLFGVFIGLAPFRACTRASSVPKSNAPDPASIANELLAVDRDFASAAASRDLISALSAMFADDVIMSGAPKHAEGKTASVAALRGNAENATSHISWQPIRAGVSSDGTHGFTQGYIATTRANGTVLPGKYLSYWVKGADGWRVMSYKRVGRPAGDVSTAMLAPYLPPRGLPANAAQMSTFQDELRKAESAFSADATLMGIGPAFAKWGAEDAVNLGAGAEWAVGVKQIAEQIGTAGPSGPRPAITWSSSQVIVAPSGDFGVSIGYIVRAGTPVTAEAPGQPFFTVWRRGSVRDPWRYIAE